MLLLVEAIRVFALCPALPSGQNANPACKPRLMHLVDFARSSETSAPYFPFHLYVPLACISFWLNDKCIAPSLLISLTYWYNQKPFIGLIGEEQMNDVGAVPPAAGETLEVFWMRSYQHNVGSHVKLPAGRARNPLPINM